MVNGSDNVQQKVAIEILYEIRVIRKGKVENGYFPSHCGWEIVDFLCSMVAGETRLEEYKTKYTTLADVESGTFFNIRFEDAEVVSFYDIVMEKICRKNKIFIDELTKWTDFGKWGGSRGLFAMDEIVKVKL